ncbi:MAG: peptidoglycan-binding protein [Clostridia bacterium]|nr:peptidoglycan-binding protein [Clostridia bacterium]
MKERIIKGLLLGAMLMLCLALTGCYVPPDDLGSAGDISLDGNHYQSIAPRITPSPTPTHTPYNPSAVTRAPEATINWDSLGATATPGIQGSVSASTTNPGGVISLITPRPVTNSPATNTPKPSKTTAAASSLKVGSTGDDVRKLQRRLKDLGYYKGSVDGDFGENTETAVKAFQNQNGLLVDGKAGTNTLNKLYSDSAKKAPTTVSSVTNTPRRTATPTPRATTVPDTDVYLEDGSSGSKVRTLQNRLIELGWMDGKADGSYDGATEYAVKAFQKRHDLWDDGVAGPSTLQLMYSNRASKTSSPVSSIGETLQEGQSSDAVKAMQKRLKELGFLSGSTDGSFGQATKAAVIAFQTANGLKADGKAGSSTLNKLYSANAKNAASLNSGSNAGSGVSVGGYQTLREGDSGKAVKNLQRALKNRGYYSGSIDGNYGSATVAAVTAFQKRNGLTVDGTAGPATQRALYGSSAEDAYDTLRPGDSSSAVRNLQYTLYELGYYDGRVDGVYGDTTEDAVRAFQIRNDLSPVDGIAGNRTQQVLYSDSAIAAAAAVTDYTSLRKGDRSNLVVEMQECLQDLGYLSDVTGYYDDATVEAVKNFQRRNNLTVDGAAGQETLRVLYSDNPRTAY